MPIPPHPTQPGPAHCCCCADCRCGGLRLSTLVNVSDLTLANVQLTGDDNSSCPARQRLGKPCNSVLTPDPSGTWRPFTDGDPAVQQKVEQYLVHVYPQPRQGLPAGTERFIGCGEGDPVSASPNLTCVLWEKRAGRQPLRPLHFLTATTTGFDALRLGRWGQVADLQWQQSSIALRTGGILNIP